jgi:hypothetical protein
MFMVEAMITWSFVIAGGACRSIPVIALSRTHYPDYDFNVQQYWTNYDLARG